MTNTLAEITPAQKRIIKDICYLQLRSLLRINDNTTSANIDVDLLLALDEVSREEFKDSLIESIDQYEKLQKNPEELDNLTEDDLRILKHILNQVDHLYKKKYPNAVKNLWKRLFILTDYQSVLQIINS